MANFIVANYLIDTYFNDIIILNNTWGDLFL